MRWGISVVLLVGACGEVAAPKIDASVQMDMQIADMAVTPDTPTGPCNLNAAFGTPTVVAGATDVVNATITYDELTIHYDGANSTPYVATRASATSAFSVGTAANGAVNSVFGPSTNQAKTILWVHSGQAIINYQERASASVAFGALVSTGVSGAHGFAAETGYYITASNGDLSRAPLTGTTLGTPTRIDSLATASTEHQPVVSDDELEIAFMRDANLMVANRTSTSADFGNVTMLTPGVVVLAPAGFSADRCRLYLTVSINNSTGLYVAARP